MLSSRWTLNNSWYGTFQTLRLFYILSPSPGVWWQRRTYTLLLFLCMFYSHPTKDKKRKWVGVFPPLSRSQKSSRDVDIGEGDGHFELMKSTKTWTTADEKKTKKLNKEISDQTAQEERACCSYEALNRGCVLQLEWNEMSDSNLVMSKSSNVLILTPYPLCNLG